MLFFDPPHRGESNGGFEALRQEALRERDICVVDAIVADDQDRILILRRSGQESFLPLCWDLPGGHVEPNESFEAALRREVMEELGVPLGEIEALVALWDWDEIVESKIHRVRQFEFLASLAAPVHRLILNQNEFVEARWISEEELPIVLENRSADDTQMRDVLRHAFSARRKVR